MRLFVASEMRLGIGYVFWLRAYVFVERISNAGVHESFGTVQPARLSGVVKILLERGDIDPDRTDNDGRTPLWGAASGGHEGVVKMLLERYDVNPDKPANNGKTPL